ncbi:hypothetical protein LDDCCGHA_0540 [Methylobacterium oxalidis]|nr:hypothetical protein LDDCCGHA_0540 [Methylobacterium oxalidis]
MVCVLNELWLMKPLPRVSLANRLYSNGPLTPPIAV